MSKKSLFLLLGVVSCVSEVELPYPVSPTEYVLNGILNPDSVISLTLHQTLPPLASDSVYPAVADARVRCYENGEVLGELTYRGQGRYELPATYPKPGGIYRVEAQVGALTLSAQDTVPPMVPFTLEITDRQPQNPNYNPNLLLTIPPDGGQERFVWISLSYIRYYSLVYGGPQLIQTSFESPLSASPYLDNFNAQQEFDRNLKNYRPLARLDPAFGGEKTIPFTFMVGITWLRQLGERLDLHVMQVSRSHDRYIKSVVVAFNNRLVDEDGGFHNPFGESTNTYSNVTNGLGFFGAMQSRKVVLQEGTE
ncbi:hypothetical protein HNQ92_003034 [Rhabdobacter roseus]|uniref:DUF4249 domain-containing protein n=1 Tax=Rhabdobacter roseus TaxID=1655419 RepID=A0A840TL27_9BACT|nr:hypothetical protein [Rhabdobacter roseus]